MSVIDMSDHIEMKMRADIAGLGEKFDIGDSMAIADGAMAMSHGDCTREALSRFIQVAITAINSGFTGDYAVELAFIDGGRHG